MRSTFNAVLAVLLAVLLFGGAPTALADEFRTRFVDCAGLDADQERLACFDGLTATLDEYAGKDSGDDSGRKDENNAAPRVVPLDDTVGSSQPQTYASRLTGCSEASGSKRQLFYLENGQVWRQSNAGRSTLRNCEADIQIEKDMFGFKMIVPSENRRIRVTRVR